MLGFHPGSELTAFFRWIVRSLWNTKLSNHNSTPIGFVLASPQTSALTAPISLLSSTQATQSRVTHHSRALQHMNSMKWHHTSSVRAEDQDKLKVQQQPTTNYQIHTSEKMNVVLASFLKPPSSVCLSSGQHQTIAGSALALTPEEYCNTRTGETCCWVWEAPAIVQNPFEPFCICKDKEKGPSPRSISQSS